MGFGTVEVRKNEKEKELIGDAIRNAAMRFGVALGLWVKEDEGKYLTTEAAGSSTSKRSTPQTKKTTGGSAASKPSEPVAEEGVAERCMSHEARSQTFFQEVYCNWAMLSKKFPIYFLSFLSLSQFLRHLVNQKYFKFFHLLLHLGNHFFNSPH